MPIQFILNGRSVSIEADPAMPLLWVLRDILGLKATKYGCGRAQCGACSLHVDGQTQRSCSLPVQLVAGKNVVTLEGLCANRSQPHPVQQAWMEENVPQCGYCQPGFMMAAAAFLEQFPNPTDEDIQQHITNVCRCGTHPRILRAIKRAAALRKNV